MESRYRENEAYKEEMRNTYVDPWMDWYGMDVKTNYKPYGLSKEEFKNEIKKKIIKDIETYLPFV